MSCLQDCAAALTKWCTMVMHKYEKIYRNLLIYITIGGDCENLILSTKTTNEIRVHGSPRPEASR